MSFEQEFPGLVKTDDSYTDLDLYPIWKGWSEEAITKTCLDKERVRKAFAKEILEEFNDKRETPDTWPAGQEWDELSGSSKEGFLKAADERMKRLGL